MAEIFIEIGAIIILAAIAASIAKLFKQPLIPAYIITGIILGPILHLIADPEIIKMMSEIGIAFLLFIVGLELDFKRLKNVGNVAIVGGLIQMGLLFGVGYFSGILLGFSPLHSSYLGLTLSFSSTMVSISLLADRNELDTLHGKITIGILLLQDVVAVLALTFYSSLGNFVLTNFVLKLLAATGLFGIALLLSRFVFPKLFKVVARNRELFFLISLAMVFAFAIAYDYIGISVVIGAFIAGIALGNLPYNIEIVSRVSSLKDFFGVMFFVGVGTELVFVNFSNIMFPLIVFTLLQVVLLPLVTIIVLSFFGYKSRTSLLTGMSLAQVSEFSIILVSSGLVLGQVSQEIFSIVIIMFIITVIITSYFMQYEIFIYNKFNRFLKPFEKLSKNSKEVHNIRQEGHQVILVGMDRIGSIIFKTLKRLHKDFMVLDINPEIIQLLDEKKFPCVYGDIGDIDLLQKLHLKHTSLVISTIPDFVQTKLLITTAKKIHPEINLIVTSYNTEEAIKLYEFGADYVIVPHFLGGEHVNVLLEDVSDDLDKLLLHKITHMKELKNKSRK